MSSRFLPSAQFVLIVGSIAASGGLVLAAQYVTHPAQTTPPAVTAVATPENTDYTAVDPNWQQTLADIQSQSPSAPVAAPSSTVADLLTASKSPNVTSTVAQSLLINLFNATSQGLGSDIPTQDQIVAQAVAQTTPQKSAPAYTGDDLTLSDDTSASLKTYGNAMMTFMAAHQTANYNNTLIALGYASDSNDPAQLAKLASIQADYYALAKDLATVPVPPTLVPLDLQVINDISAMADSFTDMEAVAADPLRAVAGVQTYQSLANETTRVFINIGQELKQNGILFTKDEPGNAWNQLLSLQ
jgi:hypothetical protein